MEIPSFFLTSKDVQNILDSNVSTLELNVDFNTSTFESNIFCKRKVVNNSETEWAEANLKLKIIS